MGVQYDFAIPRNQRVVGISYILYSYRWEGWFWSTKIIIENQMFDSMVNVPVNLGLVRTFKTFKYTKDQHTHFCDLSGWKDLYGIRFVFSEGHSEKWLFSEESTRDHEYNLILDRQDRHLWDGTQDQN